MPTSTCIIHTVYILANQFEAFSLLEFDDQNYSRSTFSYDIFISNDDSIQILDNIYRKIKIGFNLEATVQDFSYFEV